MQVMTRQNAKVALIVVVLVGGYLYMNRADDRAKVAAANRTHIDKSYAMTVCEEEARRKAAWPETVDFSLVRDLRIRTHDNGRTTITSTFTATNAYGVPSRHGIRCLFDRDALIESTLFPA
ncbi:hypothetical protein KAJ83_09820 [Marivibrio halodurans]|uniref:Uncharacterized protein n=1 Tax=Marivibrio halodurans TaxID=2039722 RepID=A0A8J7V2L9_9PROT|nr:hypothetical protein [Marivibrio halodurans]MBP5857306.1 hypothetical protein [Marivibrio halodurans]